MNIGASSVQLTPKLPQAFIYFATPEVAQNFPLALHDVRRPVILSIEDVKPAHIKSFMAKMDDAGRKPQYINDLLKVFKTFFTYLETEGYIKVSPAKRIRNMIYGKGAKERVVPVSPFLEKGAVSLENPLGSF